MSSPAAMCGQSPVCRALGGVGVQKAFCFLPVKWAME